MKPPDAPGFFSSLRSLADTVLGTLRDRVALFSLELEEERNRVFASLLWIGAAVFAGMMTLIFASLTIVYVFRESALAVLVILTLLYAGLLTAAIIMLRRQWVGQPRPFAATLEELEADRACLRDKP